MPGLEPPDFILLQEDLLISSLFFNSLSFEVILFLRLMMWLISLQAGITSLENLALSLGIFLIALIQEHLRPQQCYLYLLSEYWYFCFLPNVQGL